jgi:hypothetical protein
MALAQTLPLTFNQFPSHLPDPSIWIRGNLAKPVALGVRRNLD